MTPPSLTPAHIQQASAAIDHALTAWHATLLGIGEYAVPVCVVITPFLLAPALRSNLTASRWVSIASGAVLGIVVGAAVTALVAVTFTVPPVSTACRNAAAMLRSTPVAGPATTADIAAAVRLQRRVSRICGRS